jgi:Ku70/Ku80 beta-barrel domain
MPRAYWKGYLRLSLVTCPIELFPATSQSEKTHFHQINTRNGHRLRQQMVDAETGRPGDSEHKARGYELSKGKYVEIDEDAESHSDREHPYGRHRGIRTALPDRQALSRQALLHRAERKDRGGSIRGHS